MAQTSARSLARRVWGHPVLWAVVCIVAALPLLGTDHDFWGFLLSLLAGWAVAHAVVRGLFRIRSTALSASIHVALSALAGLMMFALAQPGPWPVAVPSTVQTALSFAAITFSGWIWLALIGRVTGAMQAASDRRAAQLVEPEWRRDGDAWTLRSPVVALRRSTYLTVSAVLGVLAASAMAVFVLVFTDIAQRMGPMALLLILGWTVGMPVYLVVRAVARTRTVEVDVRLGPGGVCVRRTDGRTLIDAPLNGIRTLFVSSVNAPTRIVLRPAEGAGLVLLVGMARRPAGAAPTVPELPPRLVRVLEGAGLEVSSARRNRTGEVTLARA
ncbi:MAG: putative rane protein [Microbacterium sp.]|jgi:hypothetical protein|nr:putative rane protein [Microbacterium sp.]